MASFFTVLLIGISLSMDAFSLALVYGMTGMPNRKKFILSLIVATYHFFMPLLGLLLGTIINNFNFISLHVMTAIILIYIGIDLCFSNFKDDYVLPITTFDLLVFGLSVSIDSLSIGVGLKAITTCYFLSSLIFSICSFIFTYLGLLLGNIIGNKIGIYSKIVGGIVLIIIALMMILK